MRANYKKPLSQLKRLILRTIDQDRRKAIQMYVQIKRQLDQQPQAMLLIGDKAVQILNNLRKQVQNMIKIYDIDKRKAKQVDNASDDILQILNGIEQQEKKDASKNK